MPMHSFSGGGVVEWQLFSPGTGSSPSGHWWQLQVWSVGSSTAMPNGSHDMHPVGMGAQCARQAQLSWPGTGSAPSPHWQLPLPSLTAGTTQWQRSSSGSRVDPYRQSWQVLSTLMPFGPQG